MRTTGASILVVVGLLALPSNAAAQDLPTNPPSGYFNEVASNPKGNVDNITYGSGYVARVYTPPGYSESQTYASMYLMHGLGGSERSWHDNDLYAHIQLDNLIAQGAVEPFILVFTRNDYDNWNFESILIDELIPYIEEHYSVSTDPDNRALGGLSMGGMQTVNIGFPNADKFHYLMPASSAPGIHGQNQLFPDGGELARNNLKLVFFSAGENEIGAYGEQNNTTVMGYCENVGISGDIIFEYFAPGGGHDRNTWRPSFWNFAQLAYQAGLTDVGGGTGGMGGNAGMGGMAGGAGMGGTSGTGTGGASVGGASGGSGTTGGSAGDGGQADTGGAGGTDAQGGATGMAGSSMSGGALATGGTTPATTGGTDAQGGATGTAGSGTGGGAPPATGGAPPAAGVTGGTASPTAGSTNAATTAPSAQDESGCACSLPGSRSSKLPFGLLAAAAAIALSRARTRRRRYLRS